ncbi:MAG: sodium-translocating pyrophosphatase, partial [Candidatus Accumulibacter sp.]|nr:sodium-translocating pyrophosphatase [Accumulibacter sp.]
MKKPHAPLQGKKFSLSVLLLSIFYAQLSFASSEANLVLPDLTDAGLASFLGGMAGWQLLAWGLLVCVAGLVFGAVIYGQIKSLPVHRSMAEVSELIYETCKTYMLTQGKFILLL